MTPGSPLATPGPRDLPAIYADIVNRRRPDLLPLVFAPEVIWGIPGVPTVTGVDAAIATLGQLLAEYPFLLQMPGTPVLEDAAGAVVGRTPIVEWGQDRDGHNVHMVGVYTDRMVETSAGWRFAQRRFEFFHRARSNGVGRFYELAE